MVHHHALKLMDLPMFYLTRTHHLCPLLTATGVGVITGFLMCYFSCCLQAMAPRGLMITGFKIRNREVTCSGWHICIRSVSNSEPANRFLIAKGFRQYALESLGLLQAGDGEWIHVASIRCQLGHSQPFIASSLLYSSPVASLPGSATFRSSQIVRPRARSFRSFLLSCFQQFESFWFTLFFPSSLWLGFTFFSNLGFYRAVF